MGTDSIPSDDVVTIIAIGVLAYASADIAHHGLGHGGACLALGGQITSLSSIFVDCTIRGSAVDLAGPLSNLVAGIAATIGAMYARERTKSPVVILFLTLVAGFNLLWFTLQMAVSVATSTDDFAWPPHDFQVGTPVRLGLVILGALGYAVAIRIVAVSLAAFALPPARLVRLMRVCWLSAGVFACITATFDPHPISAILRHAAPQSFIFAIGLLAVPVLTPRFVSIPASGIRCSAPSIVAAIITIALSVVFLGPGVTISA